jgi:hypothetical protein
MPGSARLGSGLSRNFVLLLEKVDAEKSRSLQPIKAEKIFPCLYYALHITFRLRPVQIVQFCFVLFWLEISAMAPMQWLTGQKVEY